MKLSVIVPVYNEAPTIARIVERDPVGAIFPLTGFGGVSILGRISGCRGRGGGACEGS